MGTNQVVRFLLLAAVFLSTAFAEQPTAEPPIAEIDILMTSYKGPGVTDVAPYHRGQAGQRFVHELQSDDDERFCLTAAMPQPVTGLWQGNMEPTYWIRTRGKPEDAEAYAVSHGKKYDQDAVLVFVTDPQGKAEKYILTLPVEVPIKATLAALKAGGFKGATIAKGQIMIIEPDHSTREAVRQVAEALKAKFEEHRGRMHLIPKADYAPVLNSHRPCHQ